MYTYATIVGLQEVFRQCHSIEGSKLFLGVILGLSGRQPTTKVVSMPVYFLILAVHVHLFASHATRSSTIFRVFSLASSCSISLSLGGLNRYMTKIHLGFYKWNCLQVKYKRCGNLVFSTNKKICFSSLTGTPKHITKSKVPCLPLVPLCDMRSVAVLCHKEWASCSQELRRLHTGKTAAKGVPLKNTQFPSCQENVQTE